MLVSASLVELPPGPPLRKFPTPVSHLEQSLFRHIRLADIDVLSALQCINRVSSLTIPEEAAELHSESIKSLFYKLLSVLLFFLCYCLRNLLFSQDRCQSLTPNCSPFMSTFHIDFSLILFLTVLFLFRFISYVICVQIVFQSCPPHN